MRKELLSELQEVFEELTEKKELLLAENMVMLKDLGIDSVSLINYVLYLETRMDVSIGDDILFDLQTVGDLIDHILDSRKEVAL